MSSCMMTQDWIIKLGIANWYSTIALQMQGLTVHKVQVLCTTVIIAGCTIQLG